MSEKFTDPVLLLMPMAVPAPTTAFFDPALMFMPYAVEPTPPSIGGGPRIFRRASFSPRIFRRKNG